MPLLDLDDVLAVIAAKSDPLSRADLRRHRQEWVRVFGRRWIEAHGGRFTNQGFDWHVFSRRVSSYVAGEDAIIRVRACVEHDRQLLVWPEEFGVGSVIEAKAGLGIEEFRKVAGLGRDLYISPPNLAWTFVTTHEGVSSLEIGPFFADASWQQDGEEM